MEDEEPFEITDYTTASPLEKFIAAIEDTLQEWQNTVLEELSEQPSATSSKIISYEGESYLLLLHRSSLQIDNNLDNEMLYSAPLKELKKNSKDESLLTMMNHNLDFSSRSHHLQRWFGVKDFVLFSHQTDGSRITPSEGSLMLSSISVALNNLPNGFSIPIFIPIQEKWSGTYIGYMYNATEGFSIRFDSDILFSVPHTYRTFSGLLHLYESKLGISDRDSLTNSTSLSLRFTYSNASNEWYSVQTILHRVAKQTDRPKSNNNSSSITVTPPISPRRGPNRSSLNSSQESNDFTSLLWLPNDDPIEALHLALTWFYETVEDYLSDSISGQSFSQGDSTDSTAIAPAWSVRCAFAERPYCMLSETLHEMIETIENSKSYGSVSQLVSGPAVASQPLILNAVARTLQEIPFPEQIDSILAKLLRPEESDVSIPAPQSGNRVVEELKGAPIQSILGLISLHAIRWKNLRAIAMIWSELCKEFRWHWDNAIEIPNVTNINDIDYQYCLIYQKLQMLNYCIRIKKKMNTQKKSDENVSESGGGWDIEFDVDDKDDKEEVEIAKGKSDGVKEISKLTLINANKPLCIPETQDHGVMTEDMISEQQEIFSQLGTSEEGQKLRARMQSSSLLSDMQAFKAANADCILEDFVRWHSPRDWIETEEGGKLSARMEQPGNLWKQLWEEAKRVPASRQKPLFDCTTQAEKVLHYFEEIPPAELLRQIISVTLGVIYENFASCKLISSLPPISALLSRFTECLKANNWCVKSIDKKRYDVCKLLSDLEVATYRAVSLFQHFPDQTDLVLELLTSSNMEIPVIGKEERNSLSKLYIDPETGAMPTADAREYILRSYVPRPLPNSHQVVNRMYVLATDSEFRVALSVGKDVTC